MKRRFIGAGTGQPYKVTYKRQQGYVWHADIGWQPPVKASYAAVGHGG